MRRITELGNLNFSNPRGMFLPRPELLEQVGRSWVQEFDVTGTIEAHRGNMPVVGNIRRGRATALYTPTGFETLDTPLGAQKALRIEQELALELGIDFESGDQIIPATETVSLTTVYWFVKDIGLVKMYWQGGTIQQDFKIGDSLVNRQYAVPALTEEQLVSICFLKDEIPECMQIAGFSQSDLTPPPESELDIPEFILPDAAGEDNTTHGIEKGIDEVSKLLEDAGDMPEKPAEPDDEEQSALFEYAEAVANLGDKITVAGEEFGEAAVQYRNGELALEEFENEFSSFSSQVKGFMREIDRLSPPPPAKAIHQKLTGGLDKCDQAIELMDEWFDTHDSDTKVVTALLVANCIDQVTSAGEELRMLVEEN
jgi:hypothetical protein